jgi:hypothetical protein
MYYGPLVFVGACMAVALAQHHGRRLDKLSQLSTLMADNVLKTQKRVEATERWAWGGGARG